MADSVWYILCVVIGLALDWAFTDRISLSLEVLLRKDQKSIYLENVFPRAVFTLISIFIFARATIENGPYGTLFYIGIVLFIISVMFGVYRAFKGSRSSHV